MQAQILKTENINTYDATLVKCVDGDTAQLNVSDVTETVRLIAIDTPELSSQDFYADEAKDRTCGLLENANSITLEKDPKADRDKYGRLITWVYVDGELLQKILVEEGYAKVKYIYDDYKYVDELNTLQSRAKLAKRGVWKQ